LIFSCARAGLIAVPSSKAAAAKVICVFMICPPLTSGLCCKPRTLIQAYADDGRRGKLSSRRHHLARSGACKRRANYLKPKEIGVRSIVAALGLQPASIYLKLKTLGNPCRRQCRP
jgi:hypothetical protein